MLRKFTGAEATALVALSEFHYSELAGDVKIVRPMYQETTWKTYIKAMGVIRVLSEAFRRAIQKRAKEREPSPLETVALVKRTDLVELISKSKAMGTTESIAAVRALMFEPGFSHLEIWDTPLIPADNDSVLIVPSIIGAGSPVRAIENIIAQWNDHLFTDRGRILERRIKSIFSDVAGVQVQGRVVFHNLDGTEVECDLVVWWGGYLILIEAKCTKSVYNPADLFRAHHRLADAIDQLNVRLEAVTQNWSGFKSAASQLDLPDSPPPAEKVVLIAATNVTHCTGEFRNQVRILDEHVIARFFGSKDIAVSDGVQQLHVVDHIRSSDDPSVEEFLSY